MSSDDLKFLLSMRAQDIQTGLQSYHVNHFDNLTKVGMAVRLAIYIRGRDIIEYEVLKNLASILFAIPNWGFDTVLTVLEDVEFVRKVGNKILPQVPYFNDLYFNLSEKAEHLGLNEVERLSTEILNRLSKGPATESTIKDEYNVDKRTLELILETGRTGSYIDSFNSPRHENVLISPIYFSENPEGLAKAVTQHGAELAVTVLDAVRKNPGWPLESILKKNEIGTVQLHSEQVEFIKLLVGNGVLQPPAITTATGGTHHFIFTPPVGNEKIPVVNKEIYEKAMALIAVARQGQHFARFPIRNPRAVINSLSRDGWLRATSEAKEQWRSAAVLRICEFKKEEHGNWYEVHLIPTEENKKALKLALQLFDVGDVQEDRGLDPKARLMLNGGETYQEMLRGVASIKQQLIIPGVQSHNVELLDELLEQIQRGR